MAAPTTTLVYASANRLRFFLSSDGTGGTANLTTTGLGTVDTDLQTASAGNNGIINRLARVVANGYGQFAAGVQTQVKTQALWMNDRATANPGNVLPCAQMTLTQVLGTGTITPDVLPNIDGSGNPIINLVVPAQIGAWYLDIFVGGQIGA